MWSILAIKRLILQHFSNTAWLTARNISVSALSLVITYIGANYLAPETFGSYKYLIGFFTFMSIFTLTGANSALTRHIAKTNEVPLFYIAKKTAQISLYTTIFGFFIAGYYFYQGDQTFGIIFILIAILFPALQLQHLYTSYLNGVQKYREWFLYAFVGQLVITCAVGTAMLMGEKLIVLITTFFLSQILAFGVISLVVVQKNKLFQNKHKANEVYQFAEKLSLVSIIKKTSDQIDLLLAFQLIGPVATATYAINKTPIELIHSQGAVLRTLALPKFSKLSATAVRDSLHQKAILLALIMCLVAAGYIIVAPYVFDILFPFYADSVIYTQIMALSLPMVPSVLYLEALTAKKAVGSLFVTDTITPIFSISLLVVLTFWLGALGIVLGYLFNYWLRGCIAVYAYYSSF